jgi:uncharacterized protein YbcI
VRFRKKITGRAPRSVAVVLGGETLAITLQGVLSPVEQLLANSPAGATEVQDFHRQLFVNSVPSLRQELQRITGTEVGEAIAEIVPATGMWIKAFASGTVVQVFLLAQRVPTDAWSGLATTSASLKRELISGSRATPSSDSSPVA